VKFVFRYCRLTIAGEAVGGLGKCALKPSALKEIPHGVRLRWMVGADLKRVSVLGFEFEAFRSIFAI